MIKIIICLFIGLQTAWAHLPDEAFTFSFNVSTEETRPEREEKILDALDLISKVFSSEEFKKRILSHRYRGRLRFLENNKKSNKQIYQSILAGAETLSKIEDNTMDMHLVFYTDTSSRVIGYTYPSSPKVWLNTKYFNKFDSLRVASNLVHEWMHKLGYGHDYEWTEERKYTVPYAVGRIVREVASEILNEENRR